MENKQQLPNAAATLVLGILSIITGCMFLGLILGIIGLAISSKSQKLYHQNPSLYADYGMLNAGRIMSIIGIILGGLYALYYVIVVLIIGAVGFSLFEFL